MMQHVTKPITRFARDTYEPPDNDGVQCCSMDLDPTEEDWSCMHDIVVSNGQILEYVGHGLTILDVGFAQARQPLTPTFHYFEIEIVDPGENCYIAIGLTHKDYPKNRHPGWDEGSVAYHADDGKIFVGSGVGEDFGPKCRKGDVLGCGISFISYDSDESLSEDDDDDDDSSSDSDSSTDYECSSSQSSFRISANRNKNNKKKGKKRLVEVFFTRNGTVIGTRKVRMPESGFFPSIGMLSANEKVRFDLKPLTALKKAVYVGDWECGFSLVDCLCERLYLAAKGETMV